MKSLFSLFSGFVLGLWVTLSGIFKPNNWKWFSDLIVKSSKEKISLKSVLSVSSNYLSRGIRKKNNTKIRFVFD